jgi:hypothetical protein
MEPIIVLAGVGVIAVFLGAVFIALVVGIHRGDRRKLDRGPETMASRALLTVSSAGRENGDR